MENPTQAQVVSKGMKWNPQMAQKALDTHQYIKVGDKGGTNLTITGAPKYWKKNQDFVYLPDLRLAGSRQNVITVLRGYRSEEGGSYSDAQIDVFLKNAYTSENYVVPQSQGGRAEDYQHEFDNYLAFKQSQSTQKPKKEAPSITLADLSFLIDKLPEAETLKVSSKSRSSKTSKPKSDTRRNVRHVNLKQRLDSLAPGSVLDVSNMKDDGTNIKTIPEPGAGSKKHGVDGVKVVSSSAENFAKAMKLLGAEYEQYVAKYSQVAATQATTVPSVSTTTTTTTSLPTLTSASLLSPKLNASAVPSLLQPGGNKLPPMPTAKTSSLPKPSVSGLSTLPQIPIKMNTFPMNVGSPR